MRKITYYFTVLFLTLLCFSNTSTAAEELHLTPALNKLVNNFDQYQIVLVSLDKGQENCDIVDAYREGGDIVITFKYRGRTTLILSQFDRNNAMVYGSYPLSSPVGTTTVDVELKFSPDGSASGHWKNVGLGDVFKIRKRDVQPPPILTQALDKFVKNFNRYQVALVSIDKGREVCDIVDAYRGNRDIVIKFKYRGHTRLVLNTLEQKTSRAYGSYTIRLPVIGTTTVDVELNFRADGTAYGHWKNMGFKDKLEIILKR